MNRVFGIASNTSMENQVRSTIEWLESRGFAGTLTANSGDNATIGSVDDGGAVIGRADDGTAKLIYLGWINSPAPGFGEGSPLDNSDVTAKYLLQRYHTMGNRFLDGIPGSFTLALITADARKLLLACDPGGGRRMWLAQGADGIAFSSHLCDMHGLLGDAVTLGGFDSAVIASVLVRMGKSVETFTFQYEDASYNQGHVDELADLLGIRHNWVPIDAEVIRQKMSPVTTPVDAWYIRDLKSFMISCLSKLPFKTKQKYTEALLTQKLAEELFRRKIGISRYTSNAISMLVTYASFTAGTK